MFSPKFLTLVEDNRDTVDHYIVQVRAEDDVTVLAQQAYAINPTSDTTVIAVGNGGIITDAMVGQIVSLWVAEVGPSGEVTPFRSAGNLTGNGKFRVFLLPNGPESAVVTE